MPDTKSELVIRPRTGLQFLDWREIYLYRDLFFFLILRQIKIRYAQSAIGVGWALIQPLFSMIIFTVVFGKLAQIDSEGVPYPLFSLAALIPWTFFSNSVTDGVGSLVSEANMLKKIYFPRIMLPISTVAAKLMDFAIAMFLMLPLMIWFDHLPTIRLVTLPLAIFVMVLCAMGISLWMTALAVQYRDIKHGMTFAIQLAMYASPIVYPTSMIPTSYQLIYGINPMVGVIEAFRSGLLQHSGMQWNLLAISAVSSITIFLSGVVFFRTKEKSFADVA